MSQTRKFSGIIKWFDNQKGYGFITSIEPLNMVDVESQYEERLNEDEKSKKFYQTWSDEDLFCHYTSIKFRDGKERNDGDGKATFKTLEQNDKVEFIIREVKDPNSGIFKPQALDIVIIK
ncbi:cold-shock protein [Candidatus Phytoplasma pini]|uniref:Cold shock protein n=1 Tax=Candidatus Phytoplasma pini TaxID=267362 RepID=A0A559KJD7_9MOLU|nr:cold shock domain-containing protein [Candidatus Phytoplasma pini]TVY12240.1 cold shock protein [Candidatus Phytoplasma pini]